MMEPNKTPNLAVSSEGKIAIFTSFTQNSVQNELVSHKNCTMNVLENSFWFHEKLWNILEM